MYYFKRTASPPTVLCAYVLARYVSWTSLLPDGRTSTCVQDKDADGNAVFIYWFFGAFRFLFPYK